MNALTVAGLLACVAVCVGQGTTSTGLPAPSGGPLGASGPLQPNNPMAGGGPLSTVASNTATTATNNNANNGFNQVLQNPALSYGLMGGDNMMRALLMPYMSRFGTVPAWYYLRGGMDKFTSVLMSEMMSRQLARSTGMNPFVLASLTGQMFDAPDSYALSNMLFNGLGRNMQNGQMNGQMNGQNAGGLVPNGASQTGSANSMAGNNLAPFFLSSMFL